MYYRITTFSFDPAREDELMAVAQAAVVAAGADAAAAAGLG